MNGWTIFLEREGKDTYLYSTPAIGHWTSNSYHGGTSMSFFVDLGGQEDAYPRTLNNRIIPGGEWSIFLDLPSSVADALTENAWRKMLERPKNSRTALYLAILAGHKQTAQSLIDEGTDVNSKDENGQTLLLFACSKGHRDVAKFLIAKGADVNAKDKTGQTPLAQSVQNSILEVAELLLDKGAGISARTLRRAVRKGDKDMAELLLTKGAAINGVENDMDPIHAAIIADK